MKRHHIVVLVVVTVLALAFVAVAQQGQGMERFRQRREAQMQALDTIQQNAAKLKAGMEESAQAMRGGQDSQNLSEDERAKLREEFTQRRQRQQELIAQMEQDMMKLKGSSDLWREYDETMEPLKQLLTAAQSEKAQKTAGMVEQMIAQRQKQFDTQMTALGYDPAQRPRSRRQP